MKITFTLLMIVICTVLADAQTNQVSGSINTSRPVVVLPTNARYQLVPIDSLGVKYVKLDRYTGRTYIYEPSRRKWYPLDVRGGLPVPSSNTTQQYEIYPEGEPILLNTQTGQTWVLAQQIWYPITD